jgi:hypothetical protein
MSTPEHSTGLWPYTRMMAAALCSIMLFIPILLAGLPTFPFPITRSTAIIAFFVGAPLLFSAYALYRVAQFHGFTNDDDTE